MAAISAIGSGNWVADAATVWSSGVAPTTADDVTIGSSRTITVDGAAVCNTLTVASTGTLQSHASSSATITAQAGFTFQNGSTVNIDVSANAAQTFVFVGNNANSGHPAFLVQDGCTITLKGFPKKRWTTLSATAAVGATSFSAVDTTGWQAGDRVILASTQAYNATPRVDVRTTSGTPTSGMSALTFEHASGGLIGNFSSNLVIRPSAVGRSFGVDFTSAASPAAGSRNILDVLFENVVKKSTNYGIQINGASAPSTALNPWVQFSNCAIFAESTGVGHQMVFTSHAQDIVKTDNVFYHDSATDWYTVYHDASVTTSRRVGEWVRAAVFRGRRWHNTCYEQRLTNCHFSAMQFVALELSASLEMVGGSIGASNFAVECLEAAVRFSRVALGALVSGNTNSSFLYNAGVRSYIQVSANDCTWGTVIAANPLTSQIPQSFVAIGNENNDPTKQITYTPRGKIERFGDTWRFTPNSASALSSARTIPAPTGDVSFVSTFVTRSHSAQSVTLTLSGLGITPVSTTLSGASGVGSAVAVALSATQSSGANGTLTLTIEVSGATGYTELDNFAAPPTVAVNTGDGTWWQDALPVSFITANYVTAKDVWSLPTSQLTLSGSVGKLLTDNVDATISSRLAAAGYTAPDNAGITTLLTRLTALRAAALDNLDATVSSRLAGAGYTAPDNAAIAAIVAYVDELEARLTAPRAAALDNLDATITSRLAASGYTAPDNARLVLVEKILRNKTITDPVAGTIKVYDDDGATLLLQAALWEDAAGSQGYRGDGADRRDRLA